MLSYFVDSNSHHKTRADFFSKARERANFFSINFANIVLRNFVGKTYEKHVDEGNVFKNRLHFISLYKVCAFYRIEFLFLLVYFLWYVLVLYCDIPLHDFFSMH